MWILKKSVIDIVKKKLKRGGEIMEKTPNLTLPKFKKNIKDFLLSEEGKIAKKDIAKIGMSLAVLSLMFPSQVAAQHTNTFFSTGQGGHTSHSSHASHASHASHGSHDSGCPPEIPECNY